MDGLDVVDKFKRNSGPNGFKRNKKHSGQRVSAINWRYKREKIQGNKTHYNGMEYREAAEEKKRVILSKKTISEA